MIPQELSCIENEKCKIMSKNIVKSLGKRPGDFTLNLLLPYRHFSITIDEKHYIFPLIYLQFGGFMCHTSNFREFP